MCGIDDDRFAEDVARAAACGATHVNIGDLPVKPRHEKTDPADPYLEYSFILGCLFRFVVPDELRCMTPVEYEETTMTALRRRCSVLRQHGLKGRLWLLEPHCWPEKVFEQHPTWRGPRVDYPPRTRRPYYAPCIDHPEVLRLYRESVARLLRELPEIDTFRLTTNDSGSGICWSADLYSGTNGPAACRERAYGVRVRDFLQTWIDGAADAGVDARVFLSPRGMSAAQAESARLQCTGRCTVLPTPGGFPGAGASAGGPRPTIGIPDPITFLERLSGALDAPEVLITCGCETHWRLFEQFVKTPVRAYAAKAQMITDLAGDLANSADTVETLIAAWQTVAAALRQIDALPWRGLIFEHGVLSKRWLTRPFVAFPEDLTDDELSYWRPYLFEAGGPGEVFDMTNVHAVKMIEGMPQGTFVRQVCNQAAAGLVAAATQLCDVAGQVDPGDLLRIDADRVRALSHLFRTAGNAALFQVCLDRATDPGLAGKEWPISWIGIGRPRSFLRELVRDEIDNVTTLADLIDAVAQPVFKLGARADDEDCYMLPPDLSTKLRLKAQIMCRHIPDIDRLIPYPVQ